MTKWKISLIRNKGFHWTKNKDIYTKGYLFYKNKLFFDNVLNELVNNLYNLNQLVNEVILFNGSFSIVIANDIDLIAIVDRVCSLPLYYSNECKIILDSKYFCDLNKSTINVSGIKELLLSGYTTNDDTIYQNFNKINAGCYLKANNAELTIKSYFKHNHNYKNRKYCKYYKEINDLTNNAFSRLIKTFNNKQILLPLSGGYDSRFIAVMLKKNNIDNVICYTYGSKSNSEVNVSQKIAKQLGYKWIYIEYNSHIWKSFLTSSLFNNISKYCFSLSSIPCLQEVIALNAISKQYNLNNFVVIPGYCGDLYGGSYLIDYSLRHKKDFSVDWLIDYIYNKHFNFLRFKDDHINRIIKLKILNFIKIRFNIKKVNLDYDTIVSLNEEWFTLHKVEKFIMNALQTYEYFGLEWRLPLWDNELMEFWYSVKNEYRLYSKSLYKKWLINDLFIPYKVNYYKKEKSDEKIKHNIVKIIIKRLLKQFYIIFNLYNTELLEDGYCFNYAQYFLFKKINNKFLINKNLFHINGLYSLFLIEKLLKKKFKRLINEK